MKLFKNWFKIKKHIDNEVAELHNDGIWWASGLDELDVVNNPDILFITERLPHYYWYNPKKHKVYRTGS